MIIKSDMFLHKIYYFVNKHASLFRMIYFSLWIFNHLYDCKIAQIFEFLLCNIL